MRSYFFAPLLGGLCALACDDGGSSYALHTPVMTDKAASLAALLWSPSPPSRSCLEYWQVGAEETGEVQRVCAPADEVQPVVLRGLQADTPYAYRISSTQQGVDGQVTRQTNESTRNKNKVFQFRTGSQQAQSLHFAVMGDSHGNREVLRGLLTRVMQERPSLDFLVHVGDAVNDGSVSGSWFSDFVDPARNFLAAVPVHVAMGNHERGEPPPFRVPPVSGADPMVDSFVSGNAFILLADSNRDLSPGSQQQQELEQRLSSPEARAATWRFVAFHHPPFAAGWGSCDGYDGDHDVREDLVPLLTRHGVDVVFNGHVHGYERGPWQGVTYVTTGGGGGALDHACTSWPHIVVSRYVHHVVNVDIEGNHVSVTARDLDGFVIDQFVLSK